jgi:hypothetical protein
MADPVWGLLPKAQDNIQTINEAIDAAITAHEQDPDAHLGTGESLQSHRASDIIDHLAQSILVDKLEPNFFQKLQVVGTYQSVDNIYVSAYVSSFQHLGAQIVTSSTLNNVASFSIAAGNPISAAYDKDPILDFRVKVSAQGTYKAYFGIGDRDGWFDEYFAGFYVVDGALYARLYSADTGHETLSSISGVTVTNYNDYRVECVNNDTANFYVNGSLEATISVDFPVSANTSPYYCSVQTTQSTKQAFLFTYPYQFQQFI